MINQPIENEELMTVLCVDDEVNILKSMKRLLYKKKYQLLLAESGAAALDIMQQHDVHVIISDMKMPGMSGAQLLEKVATSSPHIYRILLTGYADADSMSDAVDKAKVDHFLQKPWNNEEIINVIEQGLQNVKSIYSKV